MAGDFRPFRVALRTITLGQWLPRAACQLKALRRRITRVATLPLTMRVADVGGHSSSGTPHPSSAFRSYRNRRSSHAAWRQIEIHGQAGTQGGAHRCKLREAWRSEEGGRSARVSDDRQQTHESAACSNRKMSCTHLLLGLLEVPFQIQLQLRPSASDARDNSVAPIHQRDLLARCKRGCVRILEQNIS